jgi:hypothetical protein
VHCRAYSIYRVINDSGGVTTRKGAGSGPGAAGALAGADGALDRAAVA